MSEIKHFLRKHEFPQMAKEALSHLEQFCCHNISAQHQRLAQDIIEEFILCEIDRRGLRKKKLNALQELQLLEVLGHYFSDQHTVLVRNTMFLTLFNYEGGSKSKLTLLAKLASLSIITRNEAILSCIAIWMQQQGCTSEVVASLVREIITDYFQLIPRSSEFLARLPLVSPYFAAHFVTATASLYKYCGDKDHTKRIPVNLLQIITHWLTCHSQLCLSPLLSNLQNALPRGSIIMPPTTPLQGLIHWCIEEPLQNNVNHDDLEQGISLNNLSTHDHSLYSQLHTAVLESMMELHKVSYQIVYKDIISTRDLIYLTERLLRHIGNTNEKMSTKSLQIALDRFGQAVQVALATNCVHGNLGELCWHLERLPHHRLLKIIIEKNGERS